MLIKLYEPYDQAPVVAASRNDAIVCRQPLAPEHDLVVKWVADQFTAGWASEVRAALGNRPISIWIAMRSSLLIGFCCYDAIARGFVGPIGVADSERNCGIGAKLLSACLQDMRTMGYGYAIVGGVGAPDFFRKVAGAIEITGSTPGMYRGMLKP